MHGQARPWRSRAARVVWQGVQRRWLARLERRAVSAHAVPKAEGANQGSEFAPLGPTTPGAAGADYSS
jgi:hypothetical protein